jgi:hypothetical protein
MIEDRDHPAKVARGLAVLRRHLDPENICMSQPYPLLWRIGIPVPPLQYGVIPWNFIICTLLTIFVQITSLAPLTIIAADLNVRRAIGSSCVIGAFCGAMFAGVLRWHAFRLGLPRWSSV